MRLAILMPDNATAEAYAKISADLEKRGKKIPENDMWIAAMAMECDMVLSTADAHFKRIEGLKIYKCEI